MKVNSSGELEPDLECMNSSSAEDPSRESDSISVGVAMGAAVAIVVVVTLAIVIVVLIMMMRKHKLQIEKQMITDPISPRRYIHNISNLDHTNYYGILECANVFLTCRSIRSPDLGRYHGELIIVAALQNNAMYWQNIP